MGQQISIPVDRSTVVLNGRVYNDFNEGDYIVITFTNPATTHINSADGGVTIQEHLAAGAATVQMNVTKFGPDDRELNSLRNAGLPGGIIEGSIKTTFYRGEEAVTETYRLRSGSITDQPVDTRNNSEGNAQMQYTIAFRNVKRSL